MYQPFIAAAFLVYSGLAVGHIIRAITTSGFVIAGITVPAWYSWPAAGLAILVACFAWWEMTR